MKPIDYEKLTQRRVTVPAIMLLGIAVLGWRAESITVDFLDDYFITRAEAGESAELITAQVAQTSKLLVSHISEYQLNENAKAIRQTEDAIYNLELYVAANSESQLTRDRMRELRADLGRLGRVRACIVRDEVDENCSAIL